MIEVVIPAHNAAAFLHETLESVAAQSEPPSCITVVDDASTDGTPDLAEAWAGSVTPRLTVRVLRNTGPRGPSAARNLAIRTSTADAVALLDADDILEPDHHARLRRALGAVPGALLAFGDHSVFDARGTRIPSGLAENGLARAPATEVEPGIFTFGDDMFHALVNIGIFGTSACLFRRDAALAAGLFDESMMFCEDTDFFLRLLVGGRVAFVRETVARKRVHDSNLTHERNKLQFSVGTMRFLLKLIEADRRGRIALTPMQRGALLAKLPGTVRGHLYLASCAGLQAYGQAARMAVRAGHGGTALHPRHLLCLALRPVLPTPLRPS